MQQLNDWLNISGMQFFFWLSAATMLFSLHLEKRNHGWLLMSLSTVCFIVLGLFIPSLSSQGKPVLAFLWYMFAHVVNVGVVLSYCKVSWQEAVMCSILASLTEHLASSVYVLIFVSLWSWNLAYSFISIIVYSSVWLLMGRKMAHHGHYFVKGGAVIAVFILSTMVTVILSALCKYTADPAASMEFETESVRSMLQLSQLYAIAFCMVMLVVEYLNQRQIQAQMDLSATHELLRIQKRQFHMTQENIDLITRKCHDMKHQVALLMERQGGSEELRQRYSQEINKIIEVYDSNVDTGNEVLDIILRGRSLYCSMNDITWSCSAQGAELAFVDSLDLAAIMGNALDNAVEAVQRIPDKKQRIIHVQIAPQMNMVQILIENTFDGKLIMEGKQLITRKQDRDYHGIGVKSILAIAKKYGGFASTNVKGNTFILNILLPIPKTQEQKGSSL